MAAGTVGIISYSSCASLFEFPMFGTFLIKIVHLDDKFRQPRSLCAAMQVLASCRRPTPPRKAGGWASPSSSRSPSSAATPPSCSAGAWTPPPPSAASRTSAGPHSGDGAAGSPRSCSTWSCTRWRSSSSSSRETIWHSYSRPPPSPSTSPSSTSPWTPRRCLWSRPHWPCSPPCGSGISASCRTSLRAGSWRRGSSSPPWAGSGRSRASASVTGAPCSTCEDCP